jgi:subtilisin family serine protease
MARGLSSVSFAEPSYRLVNGTPFMPANRVSVQFKGSTTPEQIDSLAKELGLTLIRPPRPDSGFPDYAFRYSKAARYRPLAVAAILDRHPLVKWAAPDAYSSFRPQFVPTDPLYSYQFHLKNSTVYNGSNVDINAEPAWDITKGLSTLKIAVLGDGVDSNHPDLFHAFSNALGYDLVNQGQADNAWNPYNNDTHETAVAGIIFAQHDNQGVSGIAPNALIRSARIFRNDYSTPTITASSAQIGQAINWAWQVGQADVMSNSWGCGSPAQEITAAIDQALTQGRGGLGTVVVFAAGNGGPGDNAVCYPGTLSSSRPGLITVGAITKLGPLASYSRVGPEINVVAPSGTLTSACIGDVVTTDLLGSRGCSDGPLGSIDYTSTFSGTSAATPQVSAIAGLMISVRPSLTAAQVRTRMCLAAKPWGPANSFGCGKVDAYRAVAPNPTATITGPSSVRPNATCTWFANVSGGISPYSYAWTPGFSTSTEMTYHNGSSNFTVTLSVMDAVGGVSNKSKNVTVSANAPLCPQ